MWFWDLRGCGWGVVHTGGGAARPIFTTLLRRGTQLSLVPITVLFMQTTTPGHTLTLPPGEVPLGLLVVGCGTASSPPTILVSLPPTIHQRDTPIPWICLGLTSLQPSIKLRPPERFCQRKWFHPKISCTWLRVVLCTALR